MAVDFASGRTRFRLVKAAAARSRRLSRNWRIAGYALFAAILFVVFLLASFPYADTISSICAPMKLRIVYSAQRMNFPIGARLENLQVISTAVQPEQVLFRSPAVTVAPTLGSILLGRPGVRVHAQLYGGAMHATVRKRAAFTVINFDLDSISLTQSQPLYQLGAVLNGDLSGNGSLQVAGVDLYAGNGRVMLNGRNITLALVNGLPSLRLGSVHAELSLAADILMVRKAVAHGPDTAIKAAGDIELQPNLADSTIGLTVSLAPTAAGRANFGPFINMLPHPPEAGPYRISGPLMSPRVN